MKTSWSASRKVVEGLLLTTPPPFPPRAIDLVDYLRLMGKMRGLSARDIVALVKVFTQSASEFLDEWFESEEVKVTLATDGVIGANGGPRSPGTAYILLHHCMGGVAGHRGLWGFVRGGMGAVSESIASAARAKGVDDPHQRHRRQGDGPRRTRARRRPRRRRRDRVHHRRLQPRPQAHLPPPARRPATCPPISSSPSATSASKAPAARSTWRSTASPSSPPTPAPRARITRPPCTSAPASSTSSAPGTTPSTAAPPSAPCSSSPSRRCTTPHSRRAGKHIMGIFLQYAPYTLREGTWDELREPFGDRVISLIEEYVAQHPRHHRSPPGAQPARSRTPLRHHRRQHLPRRNDARPDVRHAPGRRLCPLPYPRPRPLSSAAPAPTPAAASWAPPATTAPAKCSGPGRTGLLAGPLAAVTLACTDFDS